MTVDHEKGFQPNTQNERQEGHDRDVSSSIDQDAGGPEPVVAFKTWVVAFVCSITLGRSSMDADQIDPLLRLWPVVLACPRHGCHRIDGFI